MAAIAGVPLVPGQRYRARLVIKAPKAIAGEGRVRTELEGAGFREVAFYAKDALPSDWPSDQRSDPSGWTSWTAYLEGVYAGGGTGGGSVDANSDVELLGFWPVRSADSVVPVPLPVVVPTTSGDESSGAWRESPLGIVALGVAAVGAYVASCWWLRGAK